MATPEQNKEAALRFIDEVFNKGNIAHVDEALADDFVEHQAFPGLGPTKEGVRQFMEMMLKSASDMHVEVVQVVASGDRVAIHSKTSATDTGGFMPGMEPTGKRYTIEGIDIVRYGDDGRAKEHWGVGDVMGAMGQLGLLPQPPG
jgi:predicted SnoaL-like aldol condensation-catalyzing enzyme